jgi:hypothetical protein
VTGNLPTGFPITYTGTRSIRRAGPSKNYQANVAFQRDIGFNTVAKSRGRSTWRNWWRSKTTRISRSTRFANVNNLFRNEPISNDFLRRGLLRRGQVCVHDDQ